MALSQTQKGDWAVLASTLLWGATPVAVVFSYGRITPLVSLAFTTLFAAVFFAAILTFRKRWSELLKPGVWGHLGLIALFIGIIYYSLYYFGLKSTSPGNASLILLMEMFFSYLLFNVYKQESFDVRHIFGAVLMLLGALIVLSPGFQALKIGDFFILLATLSAPFGNYFQQRLRKRISSEAILFGRNLIAVPFVIFLAHAFGEKISALSFQKSFWFLLVNGFVFLGFCKFLWVEGIHRISVTKAVALESVGPLFTLFFAFLLLHQRPTLWQLSAFVPLAWGLILLTGAEGLFVKSKRVDIL